MKKTTLSVCLMFLFSWSFGQDTPVTIVKVLQAEGQSKDEIYNKVLIWCSQSFKESKSAIDVHDKEAGILSGKALFDSYYKIPGKNGDSATVFNTTFGPVGLSFIRYHFDWLVEVKDGKLRFTISHITNNYFPEAFAPIELTTAPDLPVQDKKKEAIQWQFSKLYFPGNIDRLLAGLNNAISKPTETF